MKQLTGLLLTTAIFSFSTMVNAETIVLKSGQTVEAKILEKTGSYSCS